MPDYEILRPIQHDGERHEGGRITLDEDQAAGLLAAGAIRPLSTASEPAREAPPSDVGSLLSAREQALREALEETDLTDPERTDKTLWTKSGAPALGPLRQHPELGDVTREEVDAAWAALQEERNR